MSTDFESLPKVSLVSQVKGQMQLAIMKGELTVGRRINEAEIALRLGVSRGPVREAARLLEQQGLLVSHMRRGFFVREFSRKEIDDLYELREWLEVAAVRAAVVRATPADLKSLRKQHRAIKAAQKRKIASKIVEEIIGFHRLIFALSGNARLVRVFEEIAVEISRILSVLGVGTGDPLKTIERDGALLDVLEQRDGPAAEREMLRYIRAAHAEVLEHYERRQQNGGEGPA